MMAILEKSTFLNITLLSLDIGNRVCYYPLKTVDILWIFWDYGILKFHVL